MTLFTRIINGEIPSYKVVEDENYYAFLDINPVAKGHTLVVPKQEVDYIFDQSDAMVGAHMQFAKRVAQAIKKAYPNIDEDAYYEYKQDSVCGTWEALCRTVCPDNAESVLEIGYPAIGNYKSRWAKNISRYMRADKNRSPSFNRFRMSLISALRNTESNFENAVEPTLNPAPVTTDDGENHKVRRTTF